MKLAEALQARADLNRQINQLQQRLENNVLVQEGEQPNEKPSDLFKELNSSLNELEKLVTRINLTNSKITVNGVTLTELIARRDTLATRINAYKNAISTASQNTYRAMRSEIKVLSTIDIRSFQKEVDKMSKQLRELDNTIQQTNWLEDLI